MATHYASPGGSATWAASVNIATPCSLATTNANAVAGDVTYLRGGTYYTNISPAHSGVSGNRITYAAYAGETPVITVDEAGGRWALKLVGRSWIVIDGIKSYESLAFWFIGYGSCHNEIKNCWFDKSGNFLYSTALITYYNTAYTPGLGSDHNWVHDNTFSKYGAAQREGVGVVQDIGTVRISANGDDTSRNNTFEDNVFTYGGHDNLDIGGWYNVARNNVFNNDEAYYEDLWGDCVNSPASGYFGNRCILLSNSGNYPGTAYHTLIEGNRIGYAGTPPDDDGATGIENGGAHTLVRFNDIYGVHGMGYYSKLQPGGVYPSPLDSGSFRPRLQQQHLQVRRDRAGRRQV